MQEWMTPNEAREYYGISNPTLVLWRRKGLLTVKDSMNGKRFEFAYLKDETLKAYADERRLVDKRWNR